MEKSSFQKVNEKPEDKRLRDNIQRIHHKLIVLSGKGGVGKSTVAVNIAQGLASAGKKVGVLDVDIHGPSIAKMLGIEGKRLTVKKEEMYPEPIAVSENLYALSIATFLDNPDEPIIWRGPLKMGAIKQFLQDVSWPKLDYLIIDSPPGTGDEPLSVVQMLHQVDGAVIVSTPQDIALLDARKTIAFSQKMNVPVVGIIENMSTFICPHCQKEIDIFQGFGVAKAAADFGIDLLGKIPIDRKIVESGDEGSAFLSNHQDVPAAQEFERIVLKIIRKIEK